MNEPFRIGDNLLIHDIDGKRIILDETDLTMSIHMCEHRVWEPQIREVIASSMFEGAVVVDVGANIGLHSLYAAGFIGESGNVICIEPNKHCYEILNKNIVMNGFSDRAEIYNMGIADYNGKSTMYIYNGMSGSSGMKKDREYKGKYVKQKVKVMTLDSLLGGRRCDLLKIDVEELEWDVLRGAKDTLSNDNLTVILEWHPDKMRKKCCNDAPEKILELMFSEGFRVYRAKYGKKLERMSYKDASILIDWGDLVFTRDEHLEHLLEN